MMGWRSSPGYRAPFDCAPTYFHDKIQNPTNFSHFRGEKYDSRIEQKSTYSRISFEIMIVLGYRAENIKIRHGCRVLLLLLFLYFLSYQKRILFPDT